MKAIIAAILLISLTGCVVFPFPSSTPTNGPIMGGSSGGYSRYMSAAYYPWWSMDYFYLGYGHPRYSFYYSPYFYPHYFVRPPSWYWPDRYGWGGVYVWSDPYWHDRYRDYLYDNNPSEPVRLPAGNPPAVLGEPARSRYGEPAEAYEPASRRTMVGVSESPGIGSMTVVSGADRKVRGPSIGPTRSTGVSARVSPDTGMSRPSSPRPVSGVGSSRSSSIGHRSSMGARRSSGVSGSVRRERD